MNNFSYLFIKVSIFAEKSIPSFYEHSCLLTNTGIHTLRAFSELEQLLNLLATEDEIKISEVELCRFASSIFQFLLFKVHESANVTNEKKRNFFQVFPVMFAEG